MDVYEDAYGRRYRFADGSPVLKGLTKIKPSEVVAERVEAEKPRPRRKRKPRSEAEAA